MNDAAMTALKASMDQCEQHARILAQDLTLLPPHFDAAAVAQLSDEGRRVMDQAAYRFMKLQDVLGEKILPALLDATLDPLPPETRLPRSCSDWSVWVPSPQPKPGAACGRPAILWRTSTPSTLNCRLPNGRSSSALRLNCSTFGARSSDLPGRAFSRQLESFPAPYREGLSNMRPANAPGAPWRQAIWPLTTTQSIPALS
jgi:hypothetical protein